MPKGSTLNWRMAHGRVYEAGAVGDDTFNVTGYTATDNVDGGAGNDTVQLTAAGTMDITVPATFLNIENLRGSSGDDTFIVSNARLVGITSIDGGNGNNTIQMKTGEAEVSFANITLTNIQKIAGNAAANIITGSSSGDTIDGGEGDDTINGRDGNDNLTGGLGDDTLMGGAGDDRLTGSDNTDGEDTLVGGTGNDTYVVDGLDDVIDELADNGSGTDTVVANEVTYDLRSDRIRGEVENLTLTGSRNVNGFGTRGDNVITGNDGNNKLYGLEGNDTLIGGQGTDRLEGGAGNDRLDGGTGIDTLLGGIGNDTYVVDDARDIVDERATMLPKNAPNNDTVEASITYSLTGNASIFGVIENLTLTGNTAIDGTGNELDNLITGNGAVNRLYGNEGNDKLVGGAGADILEGGDGNDTLDGGTGADTMSGGDGDDIYIVDDANDVVDESSGTGVDTIMSSVTYSMVRQNGALPQGSIEKLVLTGAANINATGNALANDIKGNDGNNTLDGGAGNDRLEGGAGTDTLKGGKGNDTYVIDSYTDTLDETSGRGSDIDTVEGAMNISFANGSTETPTIRGDIEGIRLMGTGNFNATGNGLNNELTGNSGNNRLDGGLGNDTLTGGKGADSFLFSTALNGTNNVDRITDFNAPEDTILLDHAIFTAAGAVGMIALNAFVSNLTGSATTADQRIIYEMDTGKLFYDADGSGAGAAIQFALLSANLRGLSNKDFVIF
ncbi:beta strand repeat-containing protein [Gellertiella hungarica]|uniref:Ca2+-binding RTX toxin-like protein n=1 Tax=Gellertiella hungarica TaxID=1572859 RepID=A0A7W6J9E6_9HYPH|nr:calcium-binding protein [Gellertiella hungarica]MBB4067228.1 Ca2+-binding RTX toxin-like protein [Gellertiella hungarica]